MDKLPADTGMPLPSETMPIPIDAERQARSLYWRGWGISQIADELGLKRPTVEAWKQRRKWDEAPSLSKIEDALECRLNTLIAKDGKIGGDFKEIDLLMRAVVAGARVRRFEAPGGHEGDLNEKVANRNAGERKAGKPKNHFTTEQVEQLEQLFHDELFGYQVDWWGAKDQRTRMILKSRQIGATWYFAREALLDALHGGGNQIFLSASKNQAHIFRNYIVQFAARVGVKLQGDPIVLTADTIPDGEPAAELIFLGTNARTAQGYHGNFYFDEFFWTYGFEELNKVASAMAMHKRWRRTYFSTPSTIAHQAHSYWTGERRNRRVKKADRIEIDVSHARLQAGVLCEDQIWRQIVTIEDAAARGCDLFNIEELRIEYQLLRDAKVRGVVAIEYSLEVKTGLVMKAQHSFARQRIEYDRGWIDLQSAFLSIKKALTQSGKSVTFKASRTESVGHADLAWAAMHIFINEPLDGQARPKTRMEIF